MAGHLRDRVTLCRSAALDQFAVAVAARKPSGGARASILAQFVREPEFAFHAEDNRRQHIVYRLPVSLAELDAQQIPVGVERGVWFNLLEQDPHKGLATRLRPDLARD